MKYQDEVISSLKVLTTNVIYFVGGLWYFEYDGCQMVYIPEENSSNTIRICIPHFNSVDSFDYKRLITAINETNRRREIQKAYNDENGIIPETIIKEIREPIHLKEDYDFKDDVKEKSKKMSKKEKERLIATLEKQMREAARKLDFEEAATLRDAILELKAED